MTLKSLLSTLSCRCVSTFLVVIVGQVISGGYNTFNVALLAIKEKFNITQTEVELVLMALPLGFGTGMPAGILLDRCGPRLTSVVGLLLTTPGLGFMYIATLTEDFFHDKAWLLAIFVFFAGQGFFVTFTVSWTTGAREADPRIRGILFGVFKSVLLGSPVLFTLIYDYFFKKGHIEDARNQDIGGYIMFLLISLVTVDLLTFTVFPKNSIETKDIREIPPGDGPSTHKTGDFVQGDELNGDFEMDSFNCVNENQTNSNNYGAAESERKTGMTSDTNIPCESFNEEDTPLVLADILEIDRHTPFINVLKDPTFHCLVWAIALAITSDTLIYANVGVITKCVDLQTYDTNLILVNRIITCTSALASGILLNFIPQLPFRYGLLTLGITAILISDILFVVTTKHPWLLFSGIGVLGLGTGMSWVFGAGLTFSLFGPKDYGRNWGTAIMISFIVALAMSVAIGKLYDAKVSSSESGVCTGEYCTRDWFILLSVLCTVSVLLCCIQLLSTSLNKDRKKSVLK